MSADNGTILTNNHDETYTVVDYNASSGYEYDKVVLSNLNTALSLAQARARDTEYGLSLVGFDKEEPHKEDK